MTKNLEDDAFIKAMGDVIREAREAKGWSQLEFAKNLGLKDRAHIARIELGEVTMRLSMLHRIADATGVPAEELFWRATDRIVLPVD